MSRSAATLALFLALALPAEAAERPAVVELFTSQGCSSCPPADALLAELAARPGVVALAWHVDYWDHIGWRDRFALPAATARQQGYRTRLGVRSLYTPQMVIDGRADVVGSDRGRVAALLAPARDGVAVALTVAAGEVRAVLPAGSATDLEVVLLAYLERAETAVGRGENAGRRLHEANIVRAFIPLGRWDGRPGHLALPLAALPADADAAAVLLQEPGQGGIQGAATVRLPGR
ncbi:thioredoxin family protein [Magnetospirillum sp. UT-4]|uniref:DUF1223 domain-containing protein n=1 Tax=Magnetospirillum sp. UT-4 TaxID=2681467 RepID=UPI00137D9C93|nr:DUF1223 domain-containing protein [Magnetospirillum sp. UT-4]CAA7625348.1 conserved exported hypothetical protein [Magnetospirillum sp. UT-4]